MAKRDLSGVELVLAGLTDEAGESADEKPEKTDAKPKAKQPAKPKPLTITDKPTSQPEKKPRPASKPKPKPRAEKSRPRTRTGRPPGRKTGEVPPKRKTSLSLNAELIDEFADRSWKERCQLGELVERALSFYRQHNWGRDG